MSARLIAEVSSNHHADLGRCLAFVDAAADAGCAGVKFQQFEIERLFAPEALRYDPRILARKAWELPGSFNADLATRARERGIAFSSTPFHLSAVALLEPHVASFKVASYQVLWLDLLREVGRTGKPVALATGMADMDEVDAAVEALRGAGCGELTLLHCVSTYPTPPAEANLAAIGALRERFGDPVGWSDHTVDAGVVRRAVRHHGAAMVEFHFDLDGEGQEFGGGHCWLPADVARLRAALASPGPEPATHPADGDGVKRPRPGEAHERRWRTDPSDGLRPLLEVRAELRRALGEPAP